MNNNPPRLGEQLLDFIASNNLFSIITVSPDKYLIIWSSTAPEQLDAWLAEHTKQLEPKQPTT